MRTPVACLSLALLALSGMPPMSATPVGGQPPLKPPVSTDPTAAPKTEPLPRERASAFAKLALKNIDQEFPHKPGIVFAKADEVKPPLPPLTRNRHIVDTSDGIIAAPAEAEEQRRGGTWSTVRFARKRGKLLAIVLPDGTVVK